MAIIDEAVPFPFGTASSTRIRLLASAMAAGGLEVEVIVVRPVVPVDMPESQRVGAAGTYDAVPYRYASGVAVRPAGFVARQALKTLGYFNTVRRLLALRARRRLDVVVLYTRRLRTIQILTAVCHALGLPVVLEVCEWPIAQADAGGRDAAPARRYCDRAFDRVDGVIAISKYIQREVDARFEARGRPSGSIRVPALVDCGVMDPERQESAGKDIVLCTTLRYGSAVDHAIAALAEVLEQEPDAHLHILGGLSPRREARRLADRVVSEGLAGNVTVHGYVDDRELARIFGYARVLLAPLDRSAQSESRFPTKIAEYLASGRPVITTDVGDLGEHLVHERDVVFVEPSDVPGMADAILALLRNVSTADAIGKAGREAARAGFHYEAHAGRLGEFMRGIVADRRRRGRSASCCSGQD